MDLPTWYRRRGYLHFDSPVSFRKAEKLVLSPSEVAAHSFWPFISYELSSSKVRHDKATKTLKIEEKLRPISYASHIDSLIYSYYSEVLSTLYEKRLRELGIDRSVLAFRPLGKNNAHFAHEAFSEIRRRGDCAAVAIDVSKYFDSIDHKQLRGAWSRLIGAKSLPADHWSVFRSLTRYSYVKRSALYSALGISQNNPKAGRHRACNADEFRRVVRAGGLIEVNSTGVGIPQGSPISALLSNIFLLDFDVDVAQVVSDIGGVYFRYCDDILIIVPRGHENYVAGYVRDGLKKIGLDINTKKTEISVFSTASGVQVVDFHAILTRGFHPILTRVSGA